MINLGEDFDEFLDLDLDLDFDDVEFEFNNTVIQNNTEEWSQYLKYEELADIELEYLEYVYKDENKLVALDSSIGKKIAISRKSIGDPEELMKLNSNLKILNYQGYKIGNYVELVLPRFVNSNSFYQDVYDNKELSFYIGEAKISIRAASDMFIFLNDIKSGYHTYTDKYVHTISLKDIKETDYADYYNQALFILSMLPQNYCKNEDSDIVYEAFEYNKINNVHFANMNYNEVFCFYNEAVKIFDREISSLYLYKVLEYFFLIVRKKEFEIIIDDYNKDKEISRLITKITNLYRDDELNQLNILITSIEDKIYTIIQKAVKLNIINDFSSDSFALALYKYRNSIVHGKSDQKFDLKIPNSFFGSEMDLFWKDSLKHIAEILIFKFCIRVK